MRPALPLLLALLLPGCAWPGGGDGDGAPPSPVQVGPPPDGGGFAPCASRSAQQLALSFTAEEVDDDGGLGPGLHRLDGRTFLWVWAAYGEGTLREDDVSRVNEVQLFQEGDGRLVACTRVELVTPLEADPEPRAYDVAVRLAAHRDLPPAPLRVVVNWVAGCFGCGAPRQGNATADFPPA